MNPSAANSFLKTLEEPPQGNLLMLSSSTAQRLPATIRSRCQLIRVPTPNREVALQWLFDRGVGEAAGALLDRANNAPLKALALADPSARERRMGIFEQFALLLSGRADPLELASEWQHTDAAEILRYLHGWTQDLLRLSLARTDAVTRNKDFAPRLESLARRLPPKVMFALLQRTQRLLAICDTSASPQLILEDLLVEWTRVVRAHARPEES